MELVITIGQVLFFLGFPGLILWLCARSKWLETISPVVLCYVGGIIFGNLAGLDTLGVDGLVMEPGEFAPAEKTTNLIAGLGVIFALALLIVSTDFKKWLRLAPVTLLGSVLAMASVIIVSVACALVFSAYSDVLWQVSGMLVGVYTGGTVNLAAIARALEVDAVTWGVVHTADVLVTGIWFLVLLAVGAKLFSFLRPFKPPEGESLAAADDDPAPTLMQVVRSVGVGLGVAAVPLIASQLITTAFIVDLAGEWIKNLEEPVAIIGTTTVAIGLSFIPKIRNVRGLYPTGDYLLLVFCVAVGSLATWGRLANAELFLFLYTALVVFLSVGLHATLCWLFRVDRDTTIITSVAALYGPPFVAPVAKALGNREILVSGVTSGLVGLALGNYLGLAVAYFVKWLTGVA